MEKEEIKTEFEGPNFNEYTTCSETRKKCDVDESTGLSKVCISRHVLDISNPFSTKYKNAFAKDKTLLKGSYIFRCYPQDEVDHIMSFHNKKDDATVTASYTRYDIPIEKEES